MKHRVHGIWLLVVTLAALGAVTSTVCSADGTRITREIPLSQHTVSPYVIVRTPDGGYVVAGSSSVSDTHGWATRLDSNSKPLWEYLDAPTEDWKSLPPNVNRFNGAVILPDDKVLLCGTKDHRNEIPKRITSGRVVVIDAAGHREEQDIYPKGDSQTFYTEIHKCVRWGDGIALAGETTGAASEISGTRAVGWLVKLDLSGKLLWEKREPFVMALDAIETPTHELLVLSWVYKAQGTYSRLDKFDQTGTLVGTSQVAGGDAASFVQPASPGSAITIITSDRRNVTRVVRVDSSLSELAKPVVIDRFLSKRCYVLEDRSIVMFGSVFRRGDTAAVGRLRGSSSVRTYVIEPPNESSWINDAAPTGNPREFATVRRAGVHALLAWISLEQ